MSNDVSVKTTNSFVYKKNGNSITFDLNEKANSLLDLANILKENPGCNVVINNITSYKTFNLLIALFSREQYEGIITLDLLSSNNSLNDINRHEILDLFDIPSFVRIKGFLPNNHQNAFSIWAHNQGGKFKQILSAHLSEEERKLFEEQEKIINIFFIEFMNKFYSDGSKSFCDVDPKTKLSQIYSFIQEKYPLGRELALDKFTGNFANEKNLWADDPTKIFEAGKGTSDGRAHLLALLANNSVFNVDCVPVQGELACGYFHEWNEFKDINGEILHYDLAFNIEHLSESELETKKERKINGNEIPWFKKKNEEDSLPPVTYIFKPSSSNNIEK